MIYLPKFSVGSQVNLESGETGEIIGIEGTIKVGKSKIVVHRTFYLVDIGDAVKKASEDQVYDIKEIEPDLNVEMNKFLADSLLLTKHSMPNERIDNTIKELLDEAGGK